jgi:outer membrane protein OmpA-like peptidoglycan-associated protein
MDRSRSRIPLIVIGVALVLSVVVVVLLLKAQSAPKPLAAPVADKALDAPVAQGTPINPAPVEQTDAAILADLGLGVEVPNPAQLVEKIGRALERGDIASVTRLIGRDALDDRALERLRQLAVEKPFRLHPLLPFSEVGELKLNEETRWSLNAEGAADDQRIFLDLIKKPGGWRVGRVVLPPVAGEVAQGAPVGADALGIADAFIQATLAQNFARAQSFVEKGKVSDAKIAALCILFEEGEYRLRREKPLRAVFVRPDMVGYLANIEAADGSRAAQFSLNLNDPDGTRSWRITDLNLDEMLSEYAKRVAGGDAYYTPLVRNPEGGDTLVLYFGFDEASLSPRTERQLEIVSLLLRADVGKKLTISGHTDAKGADPYNTSLSSKRAVAVKEFLATRGVDPAQVQTRAAGASQPRRPNVLDDGSDNPEGRRVNRRTEIYLDF